MTQRETNPYKYSDSNKRYMTYDWYMKKRFGGKAAKVTLDIGCTCPNIDGTRGRGGCIYCKAGSRSAVGDTLDEQYAAGIKTACRKWNPVGFIPYFQSNTNTYGDISYLTRMYNKAAAFEGALMLDIATRADCLSDEAITVLCSIAEKIPLTVELGLQTSSDRTAEKINRGHTFNEFCDGYYRLRRAAHDVNARFGGGLFEKRIMIGVHLINGLPGEDHDDMMKSARDAAALSPDMVKIHLLHILRGTALCDMYERGEYAPLEPDDYVNITCDQLEVLPEETVIGRITGDGLADDLVAPLWSRRKTTVANEIDKELFRRGSTQGCRASENLRF